MVCKCLDKSEARGKHSKAFLLCLVEADCKTIGEGEGIGSSMDFYRVPAYT